MEEINVISVRHLIYTLRGENVILDKDIAVLYGVTTGALNQAVKRNPKRFPSDFMFQLTEEEWESLKSQIVIAKTGRGGSRTLPYLAIGALSIRPQSPEKRNKIGFKRSGENETVK